jgi:hypothetical protein
MWNVKTEVIPIIIVATGSLSQLFQKYFDVVPCKQDSVPIINAVCLLSTAGRKVFRDFLRCEYSEENILFWLACEELKKETNPDVVEEKARYIYEDYISILSPKEVIMIIILFIFN